MDDTSPLVAQGKEVTPVPGGTVEVIAPSDLKEGYVLAVNVNGTVRSVRVPPGGVKEGQSFHAVPEGGSHVIPTGRWRDGLCDCFKFGCCHPMFCMGWCFQGILTGQVAHRMSRSWMGGPGARPSVSKTCQIVTSIFITFAVAQMCLQIALESLSCVGGKLQYDFDKNQEYISCPNGTIQIPNSTYTAVSLVLAILGGLYALYLLIVVCRTRAAMRAKFSIAPGCCGGCEDCCCATFCSCCTVQQMARHTHDYASYSIGCCSADCFNTRGQPEDTPEIDA